MISTKILIDELLENSHPERIQDVIVWALEYYTKNNNTKGSIIAYSITERIKEAEAEARKNYNYNNVKLFNFEQIERLNIKDNFSRRTDKLIN